MNVSDTPKTMNTTVKQLRLPMKLIFTNQMTEKFINSGKTFQIFDLAVSRHVHGLQIDTISLDAIKSLLTRNLISELEITETDMLSRREDILLLTSCIYSMFLGMCFNRDIKKNLLKTSAVRMWNRYHPAEALAMDSDITQAVMDTRFEQNQQQIQDLKKKINELTRARISRMDLALPPQNQCDYLQQIDRACWFMILLLQEKNDFAFLNGIIAAMIDYRSKTELADSLGVILIELIMNTENSNIYSYAAQKKISNLKIDKILYDQQLRNLVLKSMSKDEQRLYLSYKIVSRADMNAKKRNHIQMAVYNREYKHAFKQSRIDTGAANIETRLDEYLQKDNIPFADMNMTNCYLDTIKQTCKNRNIYFDSSITQLGHNDIAAVTLNLFL